MIKAEEEGNREMREGKKTTAHRQHISGGICLALKRWRFGYIKIVHYGTESDY